MVMNLMKKFSWLYGSVCSGISIHSPDGEKILSNMKDGMKSEESLKRKYFLYVVLNFEN